VACRALRKSSRGWTPPPDEKAVKQLFWNLLALFQDRRPKVRKAAYNGAVELLVVEDGLHVPQSLKDHCAYHAELTKAQRDKKNQNETPVDLMHVISFLNEPFCISTTPKSELILWSYLRFCFRDGSSAADLSPWRK
jgi:hypothetical protein